MNEKSLANLKNYKPGQSGNPQGRKKGSKNLQTTYKELLDQELSKEQYEEIKHLYPGAKTYRDALAATTFKKSLTNHTKALELIHHYDSGKPREAKEEKELEEVKPRWPFLHKPKGCQWEYYESRTRFNIANIGRQWGKTEITLLRIIDRSLERQGNYWWVAPTYQQTRVAFRRALKIFKKQIIGIQRSLLELTLSNGSIVAYKSSDRPDNLRGETLHGCVLDEYAMMPATLFDEIIRPMLGTTEGWVDFITTPKGDNHFKVLWDKSESLADWSRFHFSSDTSPFFSKKEFEAARNSLPKLIFDQEYLAIFLNDGTRIFRNIDACTRGSLRQPESGHTYYLAADLAKTTDFTVIGVFDAFDNHLVYYERFNRESWGFVRGRIEEVSNRYNHCVCIIDGTGVGDPIVEDLQIKLDIIDIKFTNDNKVDMVHGLGLSLEKEKISFPDIEEMKQELNSYQVKYTPTGKISYSAPEGQHDDIVTMLMLGNHVLQKYAINTADLIIKEN